MNIEEVKSFLDEIITHRRQLHQIPEVGLELPKTKEYITSKLKEFGLEFKECGHGIVVDFGEPPYVAIRADMDALPLQELNDVPYKSKHEGMMHACGHDAHAATLLTLAHYLSERKPKKGVRLLFQPGEEGHFGAVDMIKNGVLEGVEVIIGGHVGTIGQGEAPEGAVLSKKGPFMAAADEFKVRFVGKGGHGSSPHETLDPIVAAASFINAVYIHRSRELRQTHPVVITVARVSSGTTHNVIPEEAILQGTVRTLFEDDRKFIAKRLEELAKSIADMFRMKVEFEYMWGYDSLHNTPDVVDEIKSISEEIGAVFVELPEPVMGAEDFSYYLKERPGAFFFVNTANKEKGIIHPNHSAYFEVDEEKLWIPLAIFIRFLERHGRL